MQDRIVVTLLGVAVSIDLTMLEESYRHRCRGHWSDLILPDHARGDTALVARPQADVFTTLATVEAEASLAAAAHRRGELWVLRAAALVDAEGRVTLLVRLLSDLDRSVVRRGFRSAPPQLLGIDTEGGVVLRGLSPLTGDVGVSDVASSVDGVLPSRLRLSKVVVLDCKDDASEVPQVRSLDTAEALAILVSRSHLLEEWTSPLRSITHLLAQSGGAIQISYRDDATLDALDDDAFRGRPDASPRIPAPAVPHRSRKSHTQAEGVVHRGAAIDSVPLDGDRAAVLMSGDGGALILHLLDGADATVWRAADGVKLSELANAVELHVSVNGAFSRDLFPTSHRVAALTARGILSNEPFWVVDDGVSWVDSGGRTAVIDLNAESTQPLVLEASAHTIWEILVAHGPVSQRDVIEETASGFGVESATIAPEVIGLLHELEGRRLITRT